MTPEIEKKRREVFEAQLVSAHPGAATLLYRGKNGKYVNGYVQSRFDGFNAALDAVEIELPHDRSLSASDDPWQVKEWCAEAITATGLGLRIK